MCVVLKMEQSAERSPNGHRGFRVQAPLVSLFFFFYPDGQIHRYAMLQEVWVCMSGFMVSPYDFL